jgi:LssY C-terminus
VRYEEIANELLGKGVDINRQDVFHNTALDYLLYSPNFEMQTLLLENSATSGFLAGSSSFIQQMEAGKESPSLRALRPSPTSNLLPGQTIDVRLNVPVYSDRSRTGDPVEGTVTYPLCKSGELVECPQGELLVSPGTKVNGTILFAQKAPDKYSRPRLVIDFSNIVHKNGTWSPLYARVLNVDNARETVQNNEILGVIQPHASTKMSLAMTAIGMVNPVAGYTIRAMQAVYGLSIRREILYPAGTDLQIQVVRPSRLKEKDIWPGYRRLQADAELTEVVTRAPVRTHTASNKVSDVTNLMFLGTREQLISAFDEAGWFTADELSIKSAAKTVQATIRQANYESAPVSGLRIDNQLPDTVFQKALNTFAQRHHLRIWRQPGTYKGREIWVGAATHDIAISSARAKTKWSHRIDPHIDRERDWVATDLLFIGTAAAYADIDRPGAPRNTENATGDQIVTDGKITALELK